MAKQVSKSLLERLCTLTLLQDETAHAVKEECASQLFAMAEDCAGTFLIGSMTLRVENGSKVLPVIHHEESRLK